MSVTPTPELKGEVQAAIREHLDTHGPTNWKLIMERFPTVPQRKLQRWVKEVREGKAEATVVRRKLAAREAALAAATMNMPAPPPAVFLELGEFAHQKVDWMAATTQLFYDALIMRKAGLRRNEETGEDEIKNFVFFAGSIAKRNDIIANALKIQAELYDVSRMASYFDELQSIIVDEIGMAHPEIRERILRRLEELNARNLMTVDANTDI